MKKEEVIEQLRKFRWVDKYHNFKNLLPGIEDSLTSEQETITNIVEDCCTELIALYMHHKRRPTVAAKKKILLKHMDLISYAKVDDLNKDFGYELCWYISEKVDVNLRKYSDTKVYGYWQVIEDQLKTVTKRGKRINKKKQDK